jgi:hypothetical protein
MAQPSAPVNARLVPCSLHRGLKFHFCETNPIDIGNTILVVALDDATSGISPALGRMSKARAIASKARGQLQL